MLSYYFFIIYEDGSTYKTKISSQKDIDKIPKDKGYEAIKIFYHDNNTYSHIINGNDFVHIKYNKKGFLEKGQWDEPTNNETGIKLSKEIIELKGIGKEKIITKYLKKRLQKTFTGKLLDNSTYEKYRKICERWNP